MKADGLPPSAFSSLPDSAGSSYRFFFMVSTFCPPVYS